MNSARISITHLSDNEKGTFQPFQSSGFHPFQGSGSKNPVPTPLFTTLHEMLHNDFTVVAVFSCLGLEY